MVAPHPNYPEPKNPHRNQDMSRSDRISIRPRCFGTYVRELYNDRACGSCMSVEDCMNNAFMASDKRADEQHTKGSARSKYHREIKPGVWVDVYDVLHAFSVTNSALQHLIKKALAPGQRGHKDRATDMDEIVQSAIRARELEQ